MFKKIFLSISIIFTAFVGFSQQQGIYSNYMINSFYYNPAVAGSRNVHTANIAYRNAWVGFDGAPSVFAINLNGSYKNKGKSGYGATVVSERAGLLGKVGIYGTYAQHIRIGEKYKLGAGVQIGYAQFSIKLYDAQLADKNDKLLSGNLYTAKALDLNTGLHFYSDKFFLMASVNQLIGKDLKFTDFNNSLEKQFNIISGYNFDIPKRKLVFQPSVLIKYVKPLPIQLSSMLKLTYNRKMWLGLIFRTNDAFGLSAGYTFNERINLGYTFDYNYRGLRSYQSGSHEIAVSFVLTKPKADLDKKDDELNKSILDELKKREEENKKK